MGGKGRESYGRDDDPCREDQARVFEAACQVQSPRGEVAVDCVCGEQSDDGRLRRVVKEPMCKRGGLGMEWHGCVKGQRATDQRDMRQSVKKKER